VRLAVLLFVSLVGCAGSQRTTAINATDTMTDAAGVALRAYSHEHVESIIHRPGITAAAAQLEMTAFYAKVDKAEADIDQIRGLIKNARAVNDQPTLDTLEAKAASVLAELKALEVP
jgi:type IV pilus biogenesis protein CpaD/CtpE